jgi:hypothetical protein
MGEPAQDNPPPTWYVMLEPDDPPPASYTRLGQAWAAATGGTCNAMPHVTVAYLQGHASRHDVARRLCAAAGGALTIRAQRPVSFRDGPHPLFGYTLSLLVEPDAALTAWCERVVEALTPLGLVVAGPAAHLHVQVLRGMAMPPGDALRLLSATDWRLCFTATQLVASEYVAAFQQFLRWPLRMGS